MAWHCKQSQHEIAINVVANATVCDTLAALEKAPENASPPSLVDALKSRAGIGVWGKVLSNNDVTYALRENDRLEIYAALKADPKLARRQRALSKETKT